MEEQLPTLEPAPSKKKNSPLRMLIAFIMFLAVMAGIILIAINLPQPEIADLPNPTQPPQSEPAATRTLPSTFTPAPTKIVYTPTPPPAAEPTITRTATATFITLPTKTEVIAEPTNPDDTPAIDSTSTPDNPAIGCGIRAKEEGVTIENAPFIDLYHFLPTMEPGVIYEATLYHPTYYQISLDNQPMGWIDSRLLAIDYLGDNCNDVPQDETPITEFPSLCFFEALTDGAAFADPELSEPSMHEISAGTQMVVLSAYQNSYFTAYGHAGPSFYVDKDQVKLFGSCENIVYTASAIENTWLWSDPNGQTAGQLSFITASTTLFVQGDAVEGPPPPGVEGEGDWYLVMAGRQQDNTFGWIWAEYIEFK